MFLFGLELTQEGTKLPDSIPDVRVSERAALTTGMEKPGFGAWHVGIFYMDWKQKYSARGN